MTGMWQEAYLQDRVMSAEPVELICMLYERALKLIAEARASLAAGEVLARSKAISKTLEILAELEGSLDFQAGGSISQNLAQLYRHIRTRLMTANVKQQEQPLVEVESLLKTLAEAWQGVRAKSGQAAAAGQTSAAGAASSRQWSGPEEARAAGEGWRA